MLPLLAFLAAAAALKLPRVPKGPLTPMGLLKNSKVSLFAPAEAAAVADAPARQALFAPLFAPPRTTVAPAPAPTRPKERKTSGGAALAAAFARARREGRAALVPYITAGYPSADETVDLLLAMERGGADVIELGVPFTDPTADGPTIEACHAAALAQGVGLEETLGFVRRARARGLRAPVVLMGYCNPFHAYGPERLARDAVKAGVDGFLIADLPPEEAQADGLLDALVDAVGGALAYVPLVTPTTTDGRMAYLADAARRTGAGMLYCVAVAGVTGSKTADAAELEDYVARVRRAAGDVPTAIGFGVSTPAHVKDLAPLADGVVVGSALIRDLDASAGLSAPARADLLANFVADLAAATPAPRPMVTAGAAAASDRGPLPDRFGAFGGRYVPETLAAAHSELEGAYDAARADPAFREELAFYRKQFAGGPTPLYRADRLTEATGGATIWLKREELAHTGAHKINNAIGQALLAKRMGKQRVICETGAGQHGVAVATVCALLGLECVVYMGAADCARQALNVFRMNVLGAQVVPCRGGAQTLKSAVNEAMRDWVTNVDTTHFLVGSAIGPHPFPTIVRDFQSVIGSEAREQYLDANKGVLPSAVVACVGGGSNAIGTFSAFLDDPVALYGAEGSAAAALSNGKPGVLHGCASYLLQDEAGQIEPTSSISAGLDYPGVGPQHAHLKESGRATYEPVSDEEALAAFLLLSRTEGIIPALEPSHGLALAIKVGKELGPGKNVVVSLCGRGDKDMPTVADALGFDLLDYTPDATGYPAVE